MPDHRIYADLGELINYPAASGRGIKNPNQKSKIQNSRGPFCCPRCGGQMKIISFITEPQVIRHILEHLDLWVQRPSRDPPSQEAFDQNGEIVYEPR